MLSVSRLCLCLHFTGTDVVVEQDYSLRLNLILDTNKTCLDSFRWKTGSSVARCDGMSLNLQHNLTYIVIGSLVFDNKIYLKKLNLKVLLFIAKLFEPKAPRQQLNLTYSVQFNALCPIKKGTQIIQKGDQQGTKKGTQNSSCSIYRKELTC